MPYQGFLLAIVGFAILNGMFSPILLSQTRALVLLLAPGLLISSPPVVVFLAYLLGSTLTIMIAGVPAALYERAVGAEAPTAASMWIWLAGAAVLSLPAVVTFLRVGGF